MRIRLLSDSCAKGWTRWGHDELWLADEALVRIGKPRPTTQAAAALATALTAREEMDVRWDSWAHYLAGHNDVLEIAFEQITAVRLRAGLATSSLAVRLRHGAMVRLLWKRTPGALPAIQAVLKPR